MDTKTAQALGRHFDELYWDHPPGLPTVEHAYFHLQTTLGKLAEFFLSLSQATPGDLIDTKLVTEEIIPDLLDLTLKLANDPTFAIEDVGQALQNRWRTLAWRMGPPEDGPFWGNPSGCSCEHTHRSNATCSCTERSRGAIPDPAPET